MSVRRRQFLKLSGAALLSSGLPRLLRAADNASLYDIERFGNARILHLTDAHAQLNPVYFREPSVNIGVGEMKGRPPHLVGKASASALTAPTPTPSPRSISKSRRRASASSAALRI